MCWNVNVKCWLSILLIGFTFGPQLCAQEVLRGPYLQKIIIDDDDENCVETTIRWRTDTHDISDELSMVLIYDVDSDGFVTGSPQMFTSSPDDCDHYEFETFPQNFWEHIVHIDCLDPSKKYFYTIGTYETDDQDLHLIEGWDDDDNDTNDEEYYFITPTQDEDETLHMWVLGDPGTGRKNENTGSVSDSLRAVSVRHSFYGEGNYLDEKGLDRDEIDWLVTNGDNAYGHGTDWQQQQAIFNTYEEALRNKAYYPGVGNHDLDIPDIFFENFTSPTHSLNAPDKPGAFYSMENKSTLFIMLDSNGHYYYTSSVLEEYRNNLKTFLVETLENNTKKWVVVVVHNPPYTAGHHHSDSSQEYDTFFAREELVPIFDQYGVDLVISGNDHVYQRSHLMRGVYEKSYDPLPYDEDYHYLQYGDPIEDEEDIFQYYKTSNNDAKPYEDPEMDGTVYVVMGCSGKVNQRNHEHPSLVMLGDQDDDDVVLGKLGSLHLEVTEDYIRTTFVSPTEMGEETHFEINDAFQINKSDQSDIAGTETEETEETPEETEETPEETEETPEETEETPEETAETPEETAETAETPEETAETPGEIIDVALSLEVHLEGPYKNYSGLMDNELYDKVLFPLNHPYNKPPYNYFGTESLDEVSTYMVDWVLVEARSGTPEENASTPSTVVVERQAAILLRNGEIVTPEGDELEFSLIEGESYYFVIRHRNHLDIMTAVPLEAEEGEDLEYDFTSGIEQAYGQQQQKLNVNNKSMMIAGDYNHDGIIQVTDYEIWLLSPALLNVYSNADGNLDGLTQISDADLWLPNRARVGIVEIQYAP